MKSAFAALALAIGLTTAAPVSQALAQVVIQAPGFVAPGYGGPPGPYWRRDGDWRRREEIREEEGRRIEWRREHCARDYYGHEFCRR